MTATVATVLALAVAIESTAVLSAAVAIVAVAAASVLSIFQVDLVVWSPRPPRGRPHSRSSSRSSRSLDPSGRQVGPGGRAFVRTLARGRGTGSCARARLHGPRCTDPRCARAPLCRSAALSLGPRRSDPLSFGLPRAVSACSVA